MLLGQIANTNAQTISRALAAIGVDVYFHTVVGDNLDRAAGAIAAATARSDAVVITGGLGPTPDDLTRDAVAAAVARPLRRVRELEARVRSIFASIGRDMPESNLKQADLPEGAVPIEPEGTAPGFYLDSGRSLIVALPGVPWEMQAMLTKTVIPLLKQRVDAASLVSTEILVVGLGESATHEKIHDLVEQQSNPTIAYLAGGGQVRVRVSAKAADEKEARALITPVERQLRDRLGVHAVEGQHASLGSALGALLRERGATVAAAESLTGGLIGVALTQEPGSSDFFLGSLVCYSTQSKRDLAGVDAAVLEAEGAVSEAVARALAEAAAARYGADLGLSATGVAGPAEQDGQPVGTIFVGAAFGDRTTVRKVRALGARENIRHVAVTGALDLGRRVLLGHA